MERPQQTLSARSCNGSTRARTLIRAGALAALCACTTPPGPVASNPLQPRGEPQVIMSLTGEPLPQNPPAEEERAKLEQELADAWDWHTRVPHDEDGIIWLGRRLAYLGRYDEAIDVYTRGIERHPTSYKLLRHRGHRYITMRFLDSAIADLSRARELIQYVPDEVEPDGRPNEFGKPRSTTHSNVLYHLGLALYLKGRFNEALDAYTEGLQYADGNDDMLCAMSYWLMMTAERAGEHDLALEVLEPINADMEIFENHAYHRLLLFYKGELSEQDLLAAPNEESYTGPTTAYGYGNWHLIRGENAEAKQVFTSIVEEKEAVHAFGTIAAEAELARFPRNASNAP